MWFLWLTVALAHPTSTQELVAAVPKDVLAGTGPLINELSGMTVGIEIELSKDAVIDGIPCKAGKFGAGENTWGCDLSRDHDFGKFTVKAGQYAGIHMKTGTFRSARMVSLKPAAEAVEIGGATCREFLWLHPGGELAGCKLGKDLTVGKRVFKAETDLQLYASGAARSAMIYVPHTWGDKTVPSGEVEFSESGEITVVNEGYFGD